MRKTRLVPIAAVALLMAGCSEPRATFETPPPSEAETSAAEEPAEEEATEEQATEQTWDVAPSEEAPLVRGDGRGRRQPRRETPRRLSRDIGISLWADV